MLNQAVLATLTSEKIKRYQLNFVMVSNKEIKKLNAKYRKEGHVTDIISFLVVQRLFIGDIYISKKYTQEQAKKYGNTWLQELAYLIIHGVLHLCGYTDYEPVDKIKMFKKQDKIFQCLFSFF
jgi:probable rRNA maturation factor